MITTMLSLLGLFLSPFIKRYSSNEHQKYQQWIFSVRILILIMLVLSTVLVTQNYVTFMIILVLSFFLWKISLFYIFLGFIGVHFATSEYVLAWFFAFFVYNILTAFPHTVKNNALNAVYFLLGFLPLYLL